MKIVVSDPIFLPGEYRERLENLGELEVYEKKYPHQRGSS